MSSIKFLSAILLSIVIAHAQLHSDANTVGLWHFNEGSGTSTADASGHGLNGTLNSATWNTEGAFGNCLSFNNSDVTVPANSRLDLTAAITIEAWIYWPGAGGCPAGRIVAKPHAYNFWIHDQTLVLTLQGKWDQFGVPTAALVGNRWHYVAATYDGTQVKFYLNGSLLSTHTQSGAIPVSVHPLLIGTLYQDHSQYNFPGRIDEVRLSNVARADAEILANYKPNHPPSITSVPITTVAEKAQYRYTVSAMDPDSGDAIDIKLDTCPVGMRLNGSLVTWNPVNSNVGNNRVVVRATDKLGASVMQAFTLQVTNVNDVPVIMSTPPLNATSDVAYQYQIITDDPDVGDELTYSLLTFPAGMSISSRGVVSWTPTSLQVGKHNVVIRVSDNSNAADTQSYIITMVTVNHAPSVTTLKLDSATMEIVYKDTMFATDSDGDDLFWFLLEAPSGLVLGRTTGIIDWVPADSQWGVNIVKARVTDGSMSDTAEFQIYVRKVNRAPTITSVIPKNFKTDSLYTIPLTGIDKDGDSIVWSVIKKPSNMVYLANTLIWTPTSVNVGLDTLIITLSDGKLSDTLIVDFVIYAPSSICENRGLSIPARYAITNVIPSAGGITTIAVAIPENSKQNTRLQLFGIDGRKQREWVISSPGYFNVKWDGASGNGKPSSAGLYVLRLQGGETSVSRIFIKTK